MYYFSIGAIFKNEVHILKEWLEHYFLHGVDHIYLINDNSSDNFIDILKPYINDNKVTLYDSKYKEKWVNMQTDLYNEYFQKHLKETIWFGIVDLDEFLYSPIEINIKNILKKYETQKQLHINWVHFGSSSHIKQPELVVPNFLLRGEYNSRRNGPMVNLTRQPAEGRSRDGGLRYGEMERDCMCSHGASRFNKGRLYDASDAFRVHVCKRCGMVAAYNDQKHIHHCRTCDNRTDFSYVEIPYACKLMFQELLTMNIAPRIMT